MNSRLVQIINRGMEQGLTPLLLAARIEFAISHGEIDVKPAPVRTLQCVDCGHLMEAVIQGEHTIVTCKHQHCTLYGVTLSTDQYTSLTPIQLDGYRKMVQQFKDRHHE